MKSLKRYSPSPDKPAKQSKPVQQTKPTQQTKGSDPNEGEKPYSIKVGDKTRTFKSEKAFKDFMKNLLKGTVLLSGRKSLQLKK